MDRSRSGALGDELYSAFTTRRAIAPLTERGLELSIEDAYRIQQHFIARRVEAAEVVVGKKIGLTSEAVQATLDVHEPGSGDAIPCTGLKLT